MFFGRDTELKLLEESYHSKKSELFVIYGRRRIGKSRLLEEFSKNKNRLLFEGLEHLHTSGQLAHFTKSLKKQNRDPLLSQTEFKTWDDAFTYLTERFLDRKKKSLIVLDEIQWMAARQTKLISLLKYYWDNHWKNKKLMLILCGSVSSYMVDKVIQSKALYGRISHQLHLKALTPKESVMMFQKKRSQEEIFKYLLIFGGIPKYLEEVQLNRSFSQNLNRLCFHPGGVMSDEFDKIFYSQFREPQTYMTICKILKDQILSQSSLLKKAKLKTSGGTKQYLDNLEKTGIIKTYYPFSSPRKLKLRRYKLVDEYICFYFKYIEPNKEVIESSSSKNVFELLTQEGFSSWMGFAFERFCLKNSNALAEIMGFANQVLNVAPGFGEGDKKFQIDLIYERADQVITACEVKYRHEEIGTKVIAEMEKKCSLLKLPRGYTLERTLITASPPSKALQEAEYFHHIVTLEDIL